MPIDHVLSHPWTRKHDDPRISLIPSAAKIVYPKSLQELIELCRDRPPGQHFKAAGSHWALSAAAISDHTFIETHDPSFGHQAMGRTLHEVIPGCLHQEVVDHMRVDFTPSWALAHIEAGKRIYQLYAELDTPDDLSSRETLAGYFNAEFGNPSYAQPWAFETLGGAGGQTVVGALTTGTHGGDFTLPPIADSVVAIHLVADGGKHYWIEKSDQELYYPQLTDDDKLKELYGRPELGGSDNFIISRDQALFNAVLVSVGRFGVIYSVVLRAVPQYALHERRRLHVWQDIKEQVKDRNGPLFREPAEPSAQCRFLQVAVCLTPHANFQRNLAGVTKRWNAPLSASTPGRAERVGTIVSNFHGPIQAPLFSLAGKNYTFSQDPNDPTKGDDPDPLARMCANGSFMAGVLQVAIEEIEKLIESNGAEVGAGIAAVAVVGGVGLAALFPALFGLLLILKELLEQFDADDRLGEHMETVKNGLLDPDEPDPLKRAAGLFAWQLICYIAFQSQQDDRDYDAISYAVMDQKDYRNVSCEVNVDSVEVFFNAADERLIAFIDALLAFEIMQEFKGLAFVGYASLRFTGPSQALIGMQKHAVTCAVEVACLRDVSGSQELVDYATQLALNPNYGGVLHWGQRNDSTVADVERLFGDATSPTNGNLGAWRDALSLITNGGSLDGFSSDFTRRVGLDL